MDLVDFAYRRRWLDAICDAPIPDETTVSHVFVPISSLEKPSALSQRDWTKKYTAIRALCGCSILSEFETCSAGTPRLRSELLHDAAISQTPVRLCGTLRLFSSPVRHTANHGRNCDVSAVALLKPVHPLPFCENQVPKLPVMMRKMRVGVAVTFSLSDFTLVSLSH